MTVIRLEFDIDSDVHPELHAMLSTIASVGARGERLRQLAATGLVWERARLESLPPAPLHAAARPAAMKPMVTAPVAAALAKVVPKKRPAPGVSRSSFIDLAIDAARGPAPPADPLALREFEDEIERVVRELPELFDVVLEPGEYKPAVPAPPPLARPEPPTLVASDPPSLPRQAEVSQRPVPAPIEAMAMAAADAPLPEPAEGAPALQEEAPPAAPKRTRLMRMKDKGLFKNE